MKAATPSCKPVDFGPCPFVYNACNYYCKVMSWMSFTSKSIVKFINCAHKDIHVLTQEGVCRSMGQLNGPQCTMFADT